MAVWNVIGKLTDDPSDDLNEILEIIFGPQRLLYRIDYDIIRNIEAVGGIVEVKKAFYKDGDTFISEYGHMISV